MTECFICISEYEHGLRKKEDIWHYPMTEVFPILLHDMKEHPAMMEIAMEM